MRLNYHINLFKLWVLKILFDGEVIKKHQSDFEYKDACKMFDLMCQRTHILENLNS